MNLTIAEPQILKESINVISELVSEATLKFDQDKIEIVAMDPANVAMIVFKLLSSAFVEYSVEEPINLSISLDSLNQVLKRSKPSDTINITLDQEKNKLKVQLKGNSTRTFNISLLELDESEQKVPDLQFPVSINLHSSVFNDAIDDMDIVAESVALVAQKDNFKIEAEGNLNNASVDMQASDSLNIKATDDKVKSKYSIEYLKKIVKGSKLSPQVAINFNKDYPLKVEYKVTDKLDLAFILAPRVSND